MSKEELIPKTEEYFRNNLPKSRLNEEDSPPEKEYLKHVLGCRKYALLLAKKYDADKLVIEVAALLHDIGATEAGKSHAEESAKLANKFLSNFNINKEIKEKILGCIKNHSMGSEIKNIEEQIIQDADGIIFIEDTWKDFFREKKENVSSIEQVKKITIDKVKGMMNKIKTDEGIKIANKYLNKTLKEIEKTK